MRLACGEHCRKQNIFCLKVPPEVSRTIGGKRKVCGMDYFEFNSKII